MSEIHTDVYLGSPLDPTELLTNGDFEDVAGNDFDTWVETEVGSATITDSATSHGGDHAVLFQDGEAGTKIKQTAACTAGKRARLDFLVKR